MSNIVRPTSQVDVVVVVVAVAVVVIVVDVVVDVDVDVVVLSDKYYSKAHQPPRTSQVGFLKKALVSEEGFGNSIFIQNI